MECTLTFTLDGYFTYVIFQRQIKDKHEKDSVKLKLNMKTMFIDNEC